MVNTDEKTWSGFIRATQRRGRLPPFIGGCGSLPGKILKLGSFQCILSNHGFLLKKNNFTEKNIHVMYCVS